MENKIFYKIFSDAITSNNRDAFVSDWALSSIFSRNGDAGIPDDIISYIGGIWDAAHRSMCEIADLAEMSHRKLAERFCIPYRTMENWCSGVRTPPDYVRVLMQECLGLINRKCFMSKKEYYEHIRDFIAEDSENLSSQLATLSEYYSLGLIDVDSIDRLRNFIRSQLEHNNETYRALSTAIRSFSPVNPLIRELRGKTSNPEPTDAEKVLIEEAEKRYLSAK